MPDGPPARGTAPRHHHLDSGSVNDALPAYMKPMQPLLNAYAPQQDTGVLGLGARTPIYARPAGFVQRLGTQPSHFFFSGVYVSNGIRVGLLRIPHFAPTSTTVALRELDQEIAFLNGNTDVLVVDVMRNTGGNLLVGEMSALLGGAPPEVIQNLRNNFNEVLSAYNEERGRSAPVPLNAFGSFELPPAPVPYTKPVLLLTDEFTTSTGDMFAAIMQDNQRGPLLGIRTAGAGGSNRQFDCTAYTEGVCSLTQALMNRGKVISAPGYPPSPYIENVGVHPDIVVDYMTRANLMTGGAPFVQAFTAAAVKLVETPH